MFLHRESGNHPKMKKSEIDSLYIKFKSLITKGSFFFHAVQVDKIVHEPGLHPIKKVFLGVYGDQVLCIYVFLYTSLHWYFLSG